MDVEPLGNGATTAPFKARVKKKKRSPGSHGGSNGSTAASTVGWPSGIVLQPTVTQPDAMEIGVILSFLVLLVYAIGFYEVFWALPATPPEPVWQDHMGQNLNLAVPNEWDHLRDADDDAGDSSTGNIHTNNQNLLKVPVGQWPVSIQNELDQFETIVHPGDGVTSMSLPQFWSPPVHAGKLMTRPQALQIGTCAEPDPHTGSFNRGDDCPLEARTIFVAIASYRDFECRLTVESVFGRAAHPERVRVGVVDQIVDGEDVACNTPVLPCSQDPTQALCKYKHQLDVYEMEASLSIGPVFARHIGHRLYRGEYYATQSDAHVSFTQDWDADIIHQMEATQNESKLLCVCVCVLPEYVCIHPSTHPPSLLFLLSHSGGFDNLPD